jgi:hypothetical protein
MNADAKTAPKDDREAYAARLDRSAQLALTDQAVIEDVFMETNNGKFEVHVFSCTGCGENFRSGEFQCRIRFCPNCGNSITHDPLQAFQKEPLIVGGYF